MPFVRVWIHFVWATKDREPLLAHGYRHKVFDHIKGNSESKKIYLDTIGGYLEHVHLLISLGADQTVSKTAQLLKGESSYWINKNSLSQSRFEWQDEYFAVSVSEGELEFVREYIRRQEEHHRRKSFAEEYEELLRNVGLKSII